MAEYFSIIFLFIVGEFALSKWKEFDVNRLPEDEEYQKIFDILDRADENMAENKIDQAIETYHSSLSHNLRPIERLKVHCTLTSAYLMLGKKEEACNASLKAHAIHDAATMRTHLGTFLLGFARGKYCISKGVTYTWNFLPPFCESTYPYLNLRPYQMFLFQFFAPVIGGVSGAGLSNIIDSPAMTLEWLEGNPSNVTLVGTLVGLLFSSYLFSICVGMVSISAKDKMNAINISFWFLFVVSCTCITLMPYLVSNPHFWIENVVIPMMIGRFFVSYIIPRYYREVRQRAKQS
ncbi:MAG: hypothetical protein GY797_18640 [Deltaproteobacteria bacterium]|nr:hypothetical protein [Deltaproteobacteria bacterium]